MEGTQAMIKNEEKGKSMRTTSHIYSQEKVVVDIMANQRLSISLSLSATNVNFRVQTN